MSLLDKISNKSFQLAWRLVKLLVLLLCLTSCVNYHGPAPVRNLSIEPESRKILKTGQYQVRKTDTLYSIAFRFGIDFQQLAQINKIKRPYTIYPGQVIKLRFNKNVASSSKTTAIASKTKNTQVSKLGNKNLNVAKQQNKIMPKQVDKSKSKGMLKSLHFDSTKKVTGWQWPVKNKHWKKNSFGKDTNQGIEIPGRFGEAIKAAADGRVVYSGNGLVGYGNLIIIKHNASFLSAYAHNESLIVNENELVRAGQLIAKMGKNDTGQTQLHFEIRFQGRPVNPLKFLPLIN